MTDDGRPVSAAHDDFTRLIADFSDTTDAAEQERKRQGIWERFGTEGAVFISDMANFSVTSRMRGVCHFLKMIHRTREAVAPVVADNNGTVLKCEADNCYAFFEKPGDALRAAFDINSELFRRNQLTPLEEHIYLSIGIDWGRVLLIGDEDYFGDPVNTASKLGEDLASKAEILITDRALAQTSFKVHDNAERMVARVSDIEINYVRLTLAEPTVTDQG